MTTLIKNLVIVVVAMVLGAATVLGYQYSTHPALVAQVASAAPAAQTIVDENTISSIYEKLSPSVVNITSTSGATTRPRGNNPSPTPSPNPFGGQLPQVPQPRTGTGSGVIVDDQGHILTNNHVVEGASKVDVTLANGTSVAGTVLGTDPGNDLAVVKIDVEKSLLTVAPLGDSATLKVGQLALAIGNPFDLDHTLTVGVISSVGRSYGSGTNGRPIRNMIQTDAAINPGNSGGPLINSSGTVIGINSSIESPVGANVGIGFAVPINTAKASMADMIAGKTIGHAWLGISGTSITPTLAQQLNVAAEGVYVVQVTANSPAASAGLTGTSHSQTNSTTVPTGGDVILAVDGNKVSKVEEISGYLDTKKVGDTVTLTIRRDGQTQDLKATLADWPQNSPQQ